MTVEGMKRGGCVRDELIVGFSSISSKMLLSF